MPKTTLLTAAIAIFSMINSTGCASRHDRTVGALENRITHLENSPTAHRARTILERLPEGEKRLIELGNRVSELGNTLDHLQAIAKELDTATHQAVELIDRIERLETIEQFARYGSFLIAHRDQLLELLASIEAEYRQVSRQAPGLIKAREIQIVDRAGQVIGSLGEDAFGAGRLRLRSGGGRDLITLGSSPGASGGRIQVHHSGGGEALDLWVDPSGAGNLQTAHRDAGVLVDLTHDEADGQLEVHSGAGLAVALGVIDGSNGTIETWDHRGRTLVRMGSMSTGGGSLTVYDRRQLPVVLLRAVGSELGKVDVLGPNGRARELRP